MPSNSIMSSFGRKLRNTHYMDNHGSLVFVIMSLEENGFSEYFAVVMTPIELISTNSVTSRSSFCLFGWAIFSDVEGG